MENNYDYYLLLNFLNAKLFRKFNKETNKNRQSKDYLYDNFKRQDRNYYSSFIEPITVYQISNMLHVLFNERPVATLRKNFYNRNEYYFNKAKLSFIKITTPKIINDDYYYETMHVKKGVWNAWNPNPNIYWELVKKYVDDENKYKIFINKLSLVLNIDNPENLTMDNIFEMVNDLSYDNRIDLYSTIKNLKLMDGLIYYFGIENKNKTFKKSDSSKLTVKKDRSARVINNGIEKIINLNGQILTPVNENDIFVLRNYSKGFAKLLDGGVVTIEAIKHRNTISDNGFIAVSNISTQKSIPFKNL